MPVEFKLVQFIEAGDLFKDCPLAWSEFVLKLVLKSSWLRGGEITLVKASYVFGVLRDIDADNGSELMKQIETIFSRMLNVPVDGNFYINLEN